MSRVKGASIADTAVYLRAKRAGRPSKPGRWWRPVLIVVPAGACVAGLVFVPPDRGRGLIAVRTLFIFGAICFQVVQASSADEGEGRLAEYIEERYSTLTLMIM